MPVDRIFSHPASVWGLWTITEDEPLLAAMVPFESVSETITNANKRLEFLAVRALIKSLLEEWNLPYPGIRKDEFGKPFLVNSEVRVSLSHSYPHVAAVLHRQKSVGIDLEQPKDKLLKIAPRVLSDEELEDAGNDVTKHCIYWCAKEALIKIYGKKDLTLRENLRITPFRSQQSGYLLGRILANKIETAIPLEYIVSENFVVVVSSPLRQAISPQESS